MSSTAWRIESIDRRDNMVVLSTDQLPTLKRFGAPEPILEAHVAGDYVIITCDGGVRWQIRIADGARRKLAVGDA